MLRLAEKRGLILVRLKIKLGLVNPQAVVIDTAFLTTLPANEYRSGYAEMLKHGLIQDTACKLLTTKRFLQMILQLTFSIPYKLKTRWLKKIPRKMDCVKF